MFKSNVKIEKDYYIVTKVINRQKNKCIYLPVRQCSQCKKVGCILEPD